MTNYELKLTPKWVWIFSQNFETGVYCFNNHNILFVIRDTNVWVVYEFNLYSNIYIKAIYYVKKYEMCKLYINKNLPTWSFNYIAVAFSGVDDRPTGIFFIPFQTSLKKPNYRSLLESFILIFIIEVVLLRSVFLTYMYVYFVANHLK